MSPGRSVGWRVPHHSHPSSAGTLAMEKELPEGSDGAAAYRREDSFLPQVWEEQRLSASFKWGQPMTVCLSGPGQVSSSASVCDAPLPMAAYVHSPSPGLGYMPPKHLGSPLHKGLKQGVSMILYKFPPPQFLF